MRELAASDIETVNALWKGLGYYSRAARLLEGAKKAVKELGGRLPTNAKDMEAKIPGIGRYSAGAICSIAYNQAVPVLDGNVHRLLSRVLALHAPPKAKATLDVLWAGATSMVEGSDRPGDVNQALIELGSTVCRVRDPDCGSCPLVVGCNAHKRQNDTARNDQKVPSDSDINAHEVPDIEELCALCESLPAGSAVTAYPMKTERKKAREELDIVNVVEWRHHDTRDRWFLLVKRPEGGLLAGLHEFPTAPNQLPTLTASATQALAHELLATLLDTPLGPYVRAGGAHGARAAHATSSQVDKKSDASKSPLYIASIKQAGDVIHVFSHIKKTYRVQWVVLQGGGTTPPLLFRTRDAVGGGERTQKQRARGGRSKKPPSRMESESPPADGAEQATTPQEARWLLMDDVPNAKWVSSK
ncbi:hypothetical protein EIP86_003119 [Pleurotus ostreatoroseus]|nr:hypothetical protein EIP86_003119 [Pleurotus ostreatoroseus]